LPGPLQSAVRKAVNDNPEVLARFNGLRATDAQRNVIQAGRRPRLDFTANAGVENNSTPTADYGGYATASSRLVFTQMLYDGGFNASEIERLGYSRLTRLYELQEISETIALEAVRAYGDVLRHRDLVEAATENYIEHRQVFQQVEERARAGVGRRVDVEQANGRLALSESNLLTELTNLHDVSARYQRIVGDKPPTTLPRLPENFRFTELPASPVQVLTEGLSRNPGINASLENVRALRQAIASRQMSRKPRVDLRAFQTLGQNTGGPSGSTRTTGAEAVLNFSLYDGGAGSAQEKQATFERDQARDLQEKVCRDTRQTLAIAYSDVNSLQMQLKYRDEHRLTTEKSREAYRQQFDIGQRSLLDLLDSQNEFFEATRAYINTRYNQIAAQARVLAGMGRLVETMDVARADLPTPQEFGQDRLGMDPAELCPAETTIVDTIERIKNDLALPPRRGAAPAAPPAQTEPTATLANPSTQITANAVTPVPTSRGTAETALDSASSSATALPVAPTIPATLGVSRPAQRAAQPTTASDAPATTDDSVNRAAWLSMASVDAAPAPASTAAPDAPATAPTEGFAGSSAGGGSGSKMSDSPTAASNALAAAPDTTAGSDEREAVVSALRAWAQAWMQRDMKAYADAYVPDFKGSLRSREEWLQQRTARIVPRQRIEVLLDQELVTVEGDEARVQFRQRYRSDAVQDVERRAVSLRRIDGRWLISQESRR
jgi:adhesin transport system outer membrane protein